MQSVGFPSRGTWEGVKFVVRSQALPLWALNEFCFVVLRSVQGPRRHSPDTDTLTGPPEPGKISSTVHGTVIQELLHPFPCQSKQPLRSHVARTCCLMLSLKSSTLNNSWKSIVRPCTSLILKKWNIRNATCLPADNSLHSFPFFRSTT